MLTGDWDILANGWTAVLVSVFLWWFSTGAILIVVKRADRADARNPDRSAHLRATLFGLPLLALGWFGFIQTLDQPSLMGVYLGFVSALLIWGWFELAFLCGVITGPNMTPSPPDVPAWERFVRAWGAIAYSEMALIATMIAVIALAWDAPNAFGMWTFAILFFARISAKLNLYLGVPNVNVDFLPEPMRHLESHFKIAPMNVFFPISVTALSFAVGCWIERMLAQEAGAPSEIGFALLAALSALALLEHWLMVLPLPDAKLWSWLLPASRDEISREDADYTARLEHAYLREERNEL